MFSITLVMSQARNTDYIIEWKGGLKCPKVVEAYFWASVSTFNVLDITAVISSLTPFVFGSVMRRLKVPVNQSSFYTRFIFTSVCIFIIQA